MKFIWLLLFLFLFIACGESSLDEGDLVAGGSDPQTDTDEGDEEEDPVYGDISGTISDARTGNAIAGVTVSLTGTVLTTTTDANGQYSFSNVEVGNYTFAVSEASYMSQSVSYEIEERNDNSLNISLLTVAYATNRIAIILTWDDNPQDLDSLLFVPETATSTYKIYYSNLGDVDNDELDAAPFAALDVDDTDGNGPETVTIAYTGGTPYYARTYRYFIENYDHNNGTSESIGESSAVVRVYKNGILSNTFKIDKTATSRYWHPFDISSDGTIVPTTTDIYRDNEPPRLYP